MDDRPEAGHHGRPAQGRERPQIEPDLRRPGDHRAREVSVRLYLLGSGTLAQRARALADVPTEDVFAGAGSFLPLEGRSPGVVLLLIDELAAAEAVAVLRACVQAPGGWTPVLVENRERGLRAFSLAPSQDYALEEIARYSRTGEGGLVLRLEHVTDRVRVARHEINNPLAAALVEVQLLLMDAADDETRRAFGNVQDQLRRIKDVVAGLSFPGGRPRQGPAS